MGTAPEISPICLDGRKGAVLLFHGFTSSPKEFSELALRLNVSGYAVYAPLLPGHGTTPEDLASVTKQHWLSFAESSYRYLAARYSSISVLGFSMGAALAIHVAALLPIHKLVLVAPWIKIYGRFGYVLPKEVGLTTAGRFVRFFHKEKVGNINDPKGLEKHYAYLRYPSCAVREAMAMVRAAKKQVRGIRAPVLLLHSKKDETIDWRSSKWIYERIASVDRKLILLKTSNHVVFLDYEKDQVVREIGEFIAG